MTTWKIAAAVGLLMAAGAAEAQKSGADPQAPATGAKPAPAATATPEATAAPDAAATNEATAPAAPGGQIVASDPDGVLAAMQALGYAASLGVDGANDPIITGEIEGTPYNVVFFGCQENANCQWLLFSAGFDLPNGSTLEAMNEWNSTSLVGQAFLDAEQDPFLNYFVTTTGGLTQQNFADAVDWWRVILGNFKTAIGA